MIICGDEVIAPRLQEHMPRDIAERVIHVVPMDIRAPERLVLERALELTGRKDVETDRERVSALLDAYRSGGLGTIGVERVRHAGGHAIANVTAIVKSFFVASLASTGAREGHSQNWSGAKRLASPPAARARFS